MKEYIDIYLQVDETDLFIAPMDILSECCSLYAKKTGCLFNYYSLSGKIESKDDPELCVSIRKNGKLVMHEWEDNLNQKFRHTLDGKLRSDSGRYIQVGVDGILQTSNEEIDGVGISCVYKCIYPTNVLHDRYISVYGNKDEYELKELFSTTPKDWYKPKLLKPEWTISCWLKINKQESGWINIFKRREDNFIINERKPALWINPTSYGPMIHSVFLDKNNNNNTQINTKISLGEWFHYCWQHKDTRSTIYINGEQVDELIGHIPIVGDGHEKLFISSQINHNIRNFIFSDTVLEVKKLYEYEYSDQIYGNLNRKVITFNSHQITENVHSVLWVNQLLDHQLFTIDSVSGIISAKNDPNLRLTDINGFIQLAPQQPNDKNQKWFLEHDLTISNRHSRVLDTKYIKEQNLYYIVSVPATGNDKRWFCSTNLKQEQVGLNDGRAVFIRIPNHVLDKEWLNSTGRYGYKNVSGYQTMSSDHVYSGHLLWELLPDGHVINTATREALEVLNGEPIHQDSDYTVTNLVKNPHIQDIPEQLWTIDGNYIVNNKYFQRMEFDVKKHRDTYSKNGMTLKEMSDKYIQRSRPLQMYNPKIQHGGKPYFDRFGNMVVLNNRSWKDRIGNYVSTQILISYTKDSKWITYDLFEEIVKIHDLVYNNEFIYDGDNGYDVFYHSTRLVFNRFNEAFVIYGSYIIKFDYILGIILDYKSINGASKVMESEMSTNDYIYNDYPILVGMNLGLYDGTKYICYNMNQPVPHDPKGFVTTVQHSGCLTPGFTVKGKTYIVFSSLHGEKTDSSEFSTYTGGYYGNQTPNWICVFDHSTLTWGELVYIGKGGGIHDWHNGPSICIRSNGTIFVFFGNHNTPIDYVYTTEPYSIKSFTSPQRFPSLGERQRCTYPGVMLDKNDNIYITYRGPTYGIALYKITTGSSFPIARQLFDRLKESYPISGVTYDKIKIENENYAVWRDIMTVDKEGNVYISMSPSFHDQNPHIEAQVGKFTVVFYNEDTCKLLEY